MAHCRGFFAARVAVRSAPYPAVRGAVASAAEAAAVAVDPGRLVSLRALRLRFWLAVFRRAGTQFQSRQVC